MKLAWVAGVVLKAKVRRTARPMKERNIEVSGIPSVLSAFSQATKSVGLSVGRGRIPFGPAVRWPPSLPLPSKDRDLQRFSLLLKVHASYLICEAHDPPDVAVRPHTHVACLST